MRAFFRTGIAIAAMVSMNTMALAQDMPTKVGPGEGEVDIVAWVGYIERGERTIRTTTGSRISTRTPAARSTSRPPPPPTRW